MTSPPTQSPTPSSFSRARYPFIMISPEHPPAISSPPSPPLSPPPSPPSPAASLPLLASPQPIAPLHDPSCHPPLSVASPPPLEPSDPFPQVPKVPLDFYVDDETLTSVEKIYLFCRSKSTPHRVFISRSLHTFLPGVSPLEAIEYVLPLLNTLALDDDDAVKEALVTNLVSIMWWFFQNCQLVEDEPTEDPQDPPLLPVQTFTPILGSLLIDHNAMVASPARFAVVDILNRLRAAEQSGQNRPPFATQERKMLEQEIVHQVIIGMGRLDAAEEPSPPPSPAPAAEPPQESCLLSSPQPHQPTSNSPLEASPYLPLQKPSPATPSILALSPDTHPLAPDSPLGPHSLPSQESHSPLSSLQNTNEPLLTWVPPSPHPTSEATFGDPAQDQCPPPEDDGWLTAEGRSTQDGQDDANEQAAIGRLSSMSLIATVTANAALPEETTRAFAEEVVYIGSDSLYWVRREASFAVGALAKVVPTEVVLLCLLPLFEALAHDTVWHVRHSAVFALPGILTRLTPQHRRALALDTLLPLAADVVPTVRSGVLEVLGEVIYTFHDDEGGAPEELVGMFVGREEGPERGQHGDATERRPSNLTAPNPLGLLSSAFDSDEDVPGATNEEPQAQQVYMSGTSTAVLTPPGGFFCDPARGLITSFNYPAVALSLGPRRWREVRAYYLSLTRDGNLHVRRTIAAGLGEMARILGSEIAARDLVDVWQDMVHDAADGETRLKALGGVELFVGALEGETRGGVVKDFVELWERWLTGWRERECLARALPRLAELADAQGGVVRTLVGKALVDTVAAVRDAAIGVVSPVLCAFESRPHLAEALRDDLQGLACADFCRRRATYVACYRELVEGDNGQDEIAGDPFWDHIVKLSQDRVVDVRIGVARLLGTICGKFHFEQASRPALLAETVRRLAQDPSRDVRAYVALPFAPAGSPPKDSHARPDPAAPPVIFATFSRPPPTTPPLDAMVETMQGLDMDPAVQGDRMPAHWPCGPEREDGAYSAREAAEGTVCDEQEMNSEPAKPVRRRSLEWEPS